MLTFLCPSNVHCTQAITGWDNTTLMKLMEHFSVFVVLKFVNVPLLFIYVSAATFTNGRQLSPAGQCLHLRLCHSSISHIQQLDKIILNLPVVYEHSCGPYTTLWWWSVDCFHTHTNMYARIAVMITVVTNCITELCPEVFLISL